jgi:hypothetical protein
MQIQSGRTIPFIVIMSAALHKVPEKCTPILQISRIFSGAGIFVSNKSQGILNYIISCTFRSHPPFPAPTVLLTSSDNEILKVTRSTPFPSHLSQHHTYLSLGFFLSVYKYINTTFTVYEQSQNVGFVSHIYVWLH